MTVGPSARIRGLEPYRPSRGGRPDALRLHANEGRMPAEARVVLRSLEGLDLARYASTADLEGRLAALHGVQPDRVVVTAGADDALLRLGLALLEPGRRVVLCRPTFEMLPRYVALAGGSALEVPWLDAPFPEVAIATALEAEGVVAAIVVSPAAPSGEVAPRDALERLADRARALGRLLVVDHAYVEFADDDPTDALAARGDVVITRTFSKALGLASLRVGYAVAPPRVAEWLRTVGQPYAVAGPSLALASALLADRPAIVARAATRVREERARLHARLTRWGGQPIASQANFVLARFGDRGAGIAAALDASGYKVRAFAGPGELDGALRVSCPQDAAALEGLLAALDAAAAGGPTP